MTASVEESAATDIPALELRNVTSGYGQITVLRNVDLVVSRGSVVALIGANGAGKSTLIKTAGGLIRATGGDVFVNGRSMAKQAPHQRARAGVCMVPDGRGVFPSLSVRENLMMQIPPWEKDRSPERAIDAFPLLGERLGQAAGTLSGGQQQMLALGRCYLAKPMVVLLDEVSMGLAPLIVDEIFAAIRRLSAEGVAMLLVEQYVSLALELADHVCLLDKGRVSFSGDPSELDQDALVRHYLGEGEVAS
jgi:branched-chain amino acid transport system ATP-binding protein